MKEKFGYSSLLTILLKFIVRSTPYNGALIEKKNVESENTLEWWKSLGIIKGCIGDKELAAIEILFTAKSNISWN